jgi:hypothetical protein
MVGVFLASWPGAEASLGLEVLLVLLVGWKVFAAGLGLNSCARTLNRVEAAEVGVWAPLEDWEGPVGTRMSWEGIGCGTPLYGTAPCCLCCC